MNSRLASVLFRRKTKRSKTPGRRNLLRLRSIIVLLALCMACSPAPAPRPEVESPQEEPSNPTEEIVPTEVPEEIMPTEILPTEPPVAANPVIPIPDFDEILQFGGGGAGPPFCWAYPTDGGSISIEQSVDELNLCVFLENVRTAAPIQLTIEHTDGTGITLTSNGLILDHGIYSVHSDGFGPGGPIQGWTADGDVKFAIPIWWPQTLPSGNWNITVSQANGPSAHGQYYFKKPVEESYISGLDASSEEEIRYNDYEVGSQPLQLTDNGGLIVSGGNYPANTPVYILVYDSPYSEPALVEKTAMLSDDTGAIFGELAGPFEIGAGYLLYGITDPDTVLSSLDTYSCYGVVGDSFGAACDYFQVIAAPSLHGSYSTQVPSSCPGAPPQQIIPGQSGYVCTQSERVNLREDPSRSGNLIVQLEPGTQFDLGEIQPVCADDWSWWYVSVDNNTLEMEDDVSGWLAEGGDETDPYFICPLP